MKSLKKILSVVTLIEPFWHYLGYCTNGAQIITLGSKILVDLFKYNVVYKLCLVLGITRFSEEAQMEILIKVFFFINHKTRNIDMWHGPLQGMLKIILLWSKWYCPRGNRLHSFKWKNMCKGISKNLF